MRRCGDTCKTSLKPPGQFMRAWRWRRTNEHVSPERPTYVTQHLVPFRPGGLIFSRQSLVQYPNAGKCPVAVLSGCTVVGVESAHFLRHIEGLAISPGKQLQLGLTVQHRHVPGG